jgi:hypothetical protein
MSRLSFVEILVSGEMFEGSPERPFYYEAPKPVLLNVTAIKSIEPNHNSERTYVELVGKDHRILFTSESYPQVIGKVREVIGNKLIAQEAA